MDVVLPGVAEPQLDGGMEAIYHLHPVRTINGLEIVEVLLLRYPLAPT